MLVAICDGVRTIAGVAVKGKIYLCPECNGLLTLKQGPKVIHHYAHKPPISCQWAGSGETVAHLEAKQLVFTALRSRGVRAELEFIVNTQVGDRRADVMAWSSNGKMAAIELQHSSIGREEISRRAHAYSKAGIAQIWIPFINGKVWKEALPTKCGWFLRRYTPRDFERWVYGLNGSMGMWMYDPQQNGFYLAHFDVHQIYVPQSTYYRDGEETTGGDYYKESKKYRDLTLRGPFKFEDLRLKIEPIRTQYENGYIFPHGRLVRLFPA